MLTVGLTGDVGAGKSTLCRVWQEMGASVFDADTIARDMWKLPEVQNKASARWGAGFFDLEWKKVLSSIAEKIFSDEKEYRFVSKLLHEPTMKILKERVMAAEGWVVVEIPLLYERGVPEWIDKVVYAAAPLANRIKRNERRGWGANEILRREERMLPREAKIRRADWVIENNGTLDEWEEKARQLGRVLIENMSS